MTDKIYISGFADEISSELDTQLAVMKELGIAYLSLRSADKKGIAEYTLDEVKTDLLPRLQAAGVKVSSLGSPIGKVKIDDEEGFAKQLVQLKTLCEICKLLDCRFIRMFSFYMPEGEDFAQYHDLVVSKLKQFVAIAEEYNVVLIHENEKDIYGDIASRCRALFDAIDSPCFKAAFDFANFVQCGEDTEACWDMLRDEVAYIHIKDAVTTDNENVLCGTGEGKIPQLLKRAIVDEGYEGFLTLEPHLVLFDSLQSLEVSAADDIIKENKYKDGAEGYAAQYHALQDILNTL